MRFIDFVGDEYGLIETESGSQYIGKGQFWFDKETLADVRYTRTVDQMELERQRQMAIRILDTISGKTLAASASAQITKKIQDREVE